jgi:hypothetical protein
MPFANPLRDCPGRGIVAGERAEPCQSRFTTRHDWLPNRIHREVDSGTPVPAHDRFRQTVARESSAVHGHYRRQVTAAKVTPLPAEWHDRSAASTSA